MKKRTLKGKLSFTVKDLSSLSSMDVVSQKNALGGAGKSQLCVNQIVTQNCCPTMSCPRPEGYSCGPFHCLSQIE